MSGDAWAFGPDPSESAEVVAIIRRALQEDVGSGDITSEALVAPDREGRAVVLARGRYVVCGARVAAKVFEVADTRLRVAIQVADGQHVDSGGAVLTVEGRLRPILAAERTALNFLQRLTGIATLTRQFVERVAPARVKVLDTRKTTPGLRVLEKYAVRCGGGENHRAGLYDGILIKDNHLRVWGPDLAGAVRSARARCPGRPVEIEVETPEQLREALAASPDWVLLDNMTAAQLRRCVEICAQRSRLEASGGITLDNVREIAETGVDAISLGCLTHSAPAADFSLEIERVV